MSQTIKGDYIKGKAMPIMEDGAFTYGYLSDSDGALVTIGVGSGAEPNRRVSVAFFTIEEAIKFANAILNVASDTLDAEEERERQQRIAAADEYWAMMAEEEEQANLDAMLEANLEAEANYYRESDFGRFTIDA